MMAYQDNFVVSIIHNGKPVREFNSSGTRTAVVPFGSEYKIRLKNKRNLRAKAKVTIDGMDVLTNGGCFMLDPYQTVDLERFVDDLESGKRFKFISLEEGTKTGEIQDPTSAENGNIEVTFYPEKDLESLFPKGTSPRKGGILRGQGLYGSSDEAIPSSLDTFNTTPINATNDASTKGATVEGKDSSQSFELSNDWFPTDSPVTIALQLRGPKSEPEPTSWEKSQKWEVVMRDGKPSSVLVNGVFFTSTAHGATIRLTEEGLCIQGEGVDIKTTDFSIGSR